ncbi:putative bifunctional diguanylate cyclase/phosphodiesterase [Alkalimarinus sediminis]|uniref:cyclic-guanylate-specific phosphodiesterase n=1 Tax=Alkalimarinus sediminis TaxID=1632866 RepID=A0A9E8HV96_9ALTE|nr:EAL domain-containing protein [Alkalimarinus sediminis]UZW76394.1 EAL domain-containing protein [Alkalimarinus sediminis]
MFKHPIKRFAAYVVLLICSAPLTSAVADITPSAVMATDNDSLAVKLIASAFIAVLFGLLCLILIRLNLKLQQNISQREETELSLTKLSSAVTNSGASIAITNTHGTIEYVNEKFCELTGYSQEYVLGRSIDILGLTRFPDGEEVPTWNMSCLRDNWKGDLLSHRKDGSQFWCATTISAVYDKYQSITSYIVSGIDITELKETNSAMEQLALFDVLTGLANRRLFIDRMGQSIAASQRRNTIAALLFLDLDQFKRINDTLGHDAGDELLLIVAERLKSCVRAQDTVARLGGDEFTILLNDINDVQSITHIANQILKDLKEPIMLGKHEVIISTSIGITLTPNDSQDVDSLMKNADLALYHAKERGRDGYYFFTEELNTKALKLLHIEQELRHALQMDEFSIVYQPQVCLKTGSISSIEALIRWNHPVRGEVAPDEFIAIAEETGLIVQIGEWVLKNACMQTQMLQQLTGQPIRVAVNLSSRQFSDPNLETIIEEVLVETGIDPTYLELEVTESMLMDDIDKVIQQLNRIKSAGITITIDDFGSGYSSLSYLKRLPVDILKVDREFVRDIPDDLNDMEITSAIIAIAHKLNLKVIAEGVENIDQRDFLVINKCDYAQGYYFSRPLTFEDLYSFFTAGQLKSA